MKRNIYSKKRLYHSSLQPNSLVLDIVIRSSKYTEDLNLSESLDGLRRLIATSLDAFQTVRSLGSSVRRISLTWSEMEPKQKSNGVKMLIVEKESDSCL